MKNHLFIIIAFIIIAFVILFFVGVLINIKTLYGKAEDQPLGKDCQLKTLAEKQFANFLIQKGLEEFFKPYGKELDRFIEKCKLSSTEKDFLKKILTDEQLGKALLELSESQRYEGMKLIGIDFISPNPIPKVEYYKFKSFLSEPLFLNVDINVSKILVPDVIPLVIIRLAKQAESSRLLNSDEVLSEEIIVFVKNSESCVVISGGE
jgi:hypothetical protein